MYEWYGHDDDMIHGMGVVMYVWYREGDDVCMVGEG